MFGLSRAVADELRQATSDLMARVQRLEAEQAAMRTRLEGERQARMLAANISAAARAAPTVGLAVEPFAQAMRAPLPRGRAGGLVRARTAWRFTDGTFMSESERQAAIDEFELENYERHAAGGRARAERATRAPDGTFRKCHRINATM
jgi:hypothetical protein